MSDASLYRRGQPTQRELSQFLCEEMLYDHLCGRLDASRDKAVQEHLDSHPETAKFLLDLKEAISYTESLSATELSPNLQTWVLGGGGSWLRGLTKLSWRNWPEFLRWGTEAVVMASLVALVAVAVPWEKVRKLLPGTEDVVLVKIERQKELSSGPIGDEEESTAEVLSADKEGEKDWEEVAGTEEGDTSRMTLAGSEESQQNVTTEAKDSSKSPEGDTLEGDSNAEGTAPKAVDPKTVPITVKRALLSPEERLAIDNSKVSNSEYKGLLFRAFMEQRNIKVVGEELVKLIESLGGKKAGQVELGWEKPNGRYFHFSIPESNKQSLLNGLKSYGPVRIYENPHWRVMPEGKIRFILWVQDSEYKNK